MSTERQRHQFQQRPQKKRLACQACSKVPAAFDVQKKGWGDRARFEWKCDSCGHVSKIPKSEL